MATYVYVLEIDLSIFNSTNIFPYNYTFNRATDSKKVNGKSNILQKVINWQ